jgi:Flp pilus assembly pilin Flp
MQRLKQRLFADDRGVTALIAVAIIGAVGTLGRNASKVFATVAASL